MAPKIQDLNRLQFNAKLRRLGFRPAGRIGYWRLPRPLSSIKVDERMGGESLRVRLAWMLGELDRAIRDHLERGEK